MTLLAVSALALACALLSIFVIARRWAFIGEGISHAGLGGAGTAWVAALVVPGASAGWFFQLTVILFCLATALAIGKLSRTQATSTDAAIGIFMVASFAWGILAQHIYIAQRHVDPYGFGDVLFGNFGSLSTSYAIASIAISLFVIATVALLGKEILWYCLDPILAEVSGVRAGAIHYLLMLLLALVIIVGVRIIGSVLVTALLVLPGATAARVTRQFIPSVIASLATGFLGALIGVGASHVWRFLPVGPCVVLALLAIFFAGCAVKRTSFGIAI
jgi:ABC-type Mn2+/Zn2+ transport system permease subunit